MRAVDTNVLVRILVADDEEQSARALSVLRDGIFVSDHVLMEVGWVLQRSYGFARADVRAALAGVAELEEVTFEAGSRLGTVLSLMEGGLDAGDAFILAAVPSGLSLATFDRRLRRRAELLNLAVEEP